MVKFSQDLGNESTFGLALFDVGETLHRIAEFKHLLENKIKQNFIEPLTDIKHNEIKNIMVSSIDQISKQIYFKYIFLLSLKNSRKHYENLRLDFESQKHRKKQTVNTERELQIAGERFQESKILAQAEMINFFKTEFDQINILSSFTENLIEYHKQ